MIGHPLERTNTVMLVAGDPTVSNLYGKALTHSGLSVLTSSSGEGALLQIGKGLPALVVTDAQLPGMDGLQLLRALHDSDDPLVRGLQTVMMADLPDEHLRARSQELGAVDFLVQPDTPPHQLARRVGQLLRARDRPSKVRVIRTGKTAWLILARP
jgi:two-component system chemotaxis response regulator CheY